MDVYAIVTDRIVSALENGEIPWKKPWVGTEYAWGRNNGKFYSILNQLLVEKSGEYATFGKIQKDGGKVKKGATHKDIFCWGMRESKTEKDKDGKPKMIPYLKWWQVFNIKEDTDLDVKYHKELCQTFDTVPIAEIDSIIDAYAERCGVKFVTDNGCDRAFYSPTSHEIHLPSIEQFKSVEAYYSTKFHEMIHSTGHKSLLNRFEKGSTKFGSDVYSKEELIAEIGTACILNRLGIETDDSFRNNTAYVQNWAKHIKADKKMIVSASGKAEKAVKLIFNELNEKENNDDVTEMVASVA